MRYLRDQPYDIIPIKIVRVCEFKKWVQIAQFAGGCVPAMWWMVFNFAGARWHGEAELV